jgi:hypothetical protein
MRRPSLLGLLVLLGCRIPNEEHCGRRDGDATCLEIDPSRPYCSVCEAEHDGCVAALAEIPAECRLEGSNDVAATSTGTETETGTGGEETETSTTETETETETGPAPECGNGIKEADEECDGGDFGDATCADPYQLPEGMLICVPGECVIVTSECCLADGEVCEQGECCNDNCNLITNKCGL